MTRMGIMYEAVHATRGSVFEDKRLGSNYEKKRGYKLPLFVGARVPIVDEKQSMRTKLGSQLPSPYVRNHEPRLATFT